MKKLSLIILAALLIMPWLTGCTEDDPGYGFLVDSDGNVAIVDDATGAIVTIEYEHHEIHEGSAFCYVEVVDLGNGAVRDIQITTPNTTEWTHITFDFATESEIEWWLYENVTINVAGVGVVEHNNDRNSAHAATTALAIIDNVNVGAANADTAVAAATIILHGISGAGKDSGTFEHSEEMILAQNQNYALRFVANAAGYATYHIDWYELTNH